VAEREIQSNSSDETISIGREIGASLAAPVLILLTGELGAGKTTLTKGIASGAGAAQEEEITSPTFTLIHKYTDGGKSAKRPAVYHIDLYRIESRPDLETLGLDDIFNEIDPAHKLAGGADQTRTRGGRRAEDYDSRRLRRHAVATKLSAHNARFTLAVRAAPNP
jgi:tRNA threonylcarbamoyl adenosine modification protein YjeE